MSKDLFLAASAGDMQKVLQLLNSGTDVNSQDSDGWTALHCAANSGEYEIAEMLIMRGADVNEIASGGMTPLMAAAGHDQTEIAKLLLDHKAKINARSQEGRTALHWAVVGNYNYEIVKLLLERGADYTIQDYYKKIPENLTFDRKMLKLFKEKRDHDAHIHGKDSKDFKP